jgi:hypothetical protein
MSTIFNLPDGFVGDVTTEILQCRKCGKEAKNLTYKAMATGMYSNVDGTPRRLFVYHSPLCHCDEGIWLSDGPVLGEG